MVKVWTHQSSFSQDQSLLQGGLTRCQNCVKSLPGKQVPPLEASISQHKIPGKFQFLGVCCFSSLLAKWEGTTSQYLHFNQEG